MAWTGGVFTRTNGTYSGANVWSNDKAANVKIVATRHDTHDQDLAAGINNCLTKDGQNSPTANISWGTFKITNLGNGTLATDAATYGQTVTAVSFDSGTGVVTFTRAAGNLTVDISAFSPSASLPLAGGVMSGDIQFSADINLRADTADASDTRRFAVAGGGAAAVTRGAFLRLSGNENATTPGEGLLAAGSSFRLRLRSARDTAASDGEIALETEQAVIEQTLPASYDYARLALRHTSVIRGGVSAYDSGQAELFGSGGSVFLRPAGAGNTTGQLQVAAGGNVTAAGSVSDSAGNVRRVPFNTQNGNYTFALSDLGKGVRKDGSSAVAYTIDPEGTTAYGDGFIVTVRNANAAGNITLTRGSGVVLREPGSATDANVIVPPWGVKTLVREALNTWVAL